MIMDYQNEYCETAARMLHTEPDLLDYRLIEHLNKINELVFDAGGALTSRQVIALAIVQWQEDKADDFTGEPKQKPKQTELEIACERAKRTGNHKDIQEYLRLRRIYK